MPFAAHLAVVHLSLQSPQFITQKVRIAVEDSTKLGPNLTIPSITRELAEAFKTVTLDMFDGKTRPIRKSKYIERGALTFDGLGGEDIHLNTTDVVIMNPPFSSSDHLGEKYKQKLKEMTMD